MQQYPMIMKQIQSGIPVYAFDKLDGSNIRAEWTRKNGFNKFGSRHCIINRNHEHLGEAVDLILEKYSDSLEKIFRDGRMDKATPFFEFYGPSSFAGHHVDEPHDVMLLDVHVGKRGFMDPREFIKTFSGVETAKFLFHGNINNDVVRMVKERRLEGMTFEGIVCKTTEAFKTKYGTFKVKSDEWLQRLKEKCNGDEKLFNELS